MKQAGNQWRARWQTLEDKAHRSSGKSPLPSKSSAGKITRMKRSNQNISTCGTLSPKLLGAIALSRVLNYPLSHYKEFIRDIESSATFQLYAQHIHKKKIGLIDTYPVKDLTQTTNTLGSFQLSENALNFCFHGEHCTFTYEIDRQLLDEKKNDHCARLIFTLTLINSRNEITCALIKTLCKKQPKYLTSLCELDQVPLTLEDVSKHIFKHKSLCTIADTSRVSRVIRGIDIQTHDGELIAMKSLLFSRSDFHSKQLKLLLQSEKSLLLSGALEQPWTDAQLAQLLQRHHDIRMTRRGVGLLRHRIGMPDSRERRHRQDYLSASSELGAIIPLAEEHLTSLPEKPGVYEIRTPDLHHFSAATSEVTNSLQSSNTIVKNDVNVIYLGSSRNIRARVLSHLRGHSRNTILSRLLMLGRAQLRFCVLEKNWRLVEKSLYQAYCKSYGFKPQCNRISP